MDDRIKWVLELCNQRQKQLGVKYKDRHLRMSCVREVSEELADACNILKLLSHKVGEQIKDSSVLTKYANELNIKMEICSLHDEVLGIFIKLVELNTLLKEAGIEDVDTECINRPYFDVRV